MFRLWAKEFKDNRMLRDTVICDDSDETRTHKIFNALEESQNLRSMQRQDFIRIILWIPLILIIWRSRSLRSSI